MTKLFTTRILLPILFLGFTQLEGWGQIVAWNNNALSGITAGSLNATTNNTNLNTSVLSRGAGIVASSLGGGYASNTWIDANQAAAIINNRYYQCTISPNTNYKVSLSTLDFKLRRSSTGPNVYIWRYSTDGTNFTDIGTPVSFTTTTATGDVQPQILLSGITALQNVLSGTTITLRLYAWGGTAAGGTLAFGTGNVNSLAIGGSVVSTISSNADLSNLTLSTGVLSPVFAAATTNYTASVANGVTSITTTPTAADVNSTITVNGNSVTSGSPSASITLSVGSNIITTIVTAQDAVTTKTYTVTVTRAAAGAATLSVTSALGSFGNFCINTTAGPNSFTLDGTDLDGSNIAIAALNGFSYSETAGGTYTSTLSFSYTAPGFTGKIIYVKFNPTLIQSYNGDIGVSGGAATGILVPATGTGVNTALTITTGGSLAVSATTATAAGTISVTGCSAVTTYGIEYSTSTGFINGTGTQVSSSNLSAGNFTSTITGLAPNTRYFYKAYATDGSGTTYGAQQFFTNTPLPVPMAAQSGLSFTETFTDIANWSNFFISGSGANHFNGLSAAAGSGIPGSSGVGTTGGTTLTASTSSFQINATGTPPAITSGGVQRGTDQLTPIPSTQSIILLSTGASPENSTSAAIDFYMDFTGVNAGTLSFDYQTFSNALGTGANDRAGSLRVYTSTDGVTFTELTNILSFINNTPISGSKTNIPLPATFNNSATARLRFYYHNGTGGTNGSRPKISIDNLNVTAVATTPCNSPTAPATALIFGTITDVSIQAGFTAASPASDNYLVVMSTSSSLTGNPVDMQNYNIGDNVGDGSVIAKGNATTFTATGLSPLTTYYFFIFPMNSVCTGGPLYYTASILNGSATTIAGLPPCAAPASQPTNLVFGTIATNSIAGSFTTTAADEYLVLRSTSSTLTNNPVNTQVYNAGDILGNAVVVERSTAASFTANSLLPNTQYYFFIFSINSQACVSGPAYNVTAPLNGTQTTQPLPPCVAPSAQPTSLSLTAANTSVSGTFTGVLSADDYLTIRSLSPTLSATPVDNNDYNPGDNFGGGIVVANSSATTFLASGLTPNTTYYFFVFAASKNCSGGTKYANAAPLTGNIVTTNTITNNYYFGNLHSHSDYSDGNKDQPGYTPTDDYNYALTALCMDYLGISEHNHFSSPDNPGNTITNYHSGITEATTFNSTHPTFLALYGMEWGVISGGGHVVVYGDGIDNLWGWESGSGGWGAANNYDVFVPKSVYTGSTGLFKTVNDNIATNTFASLAHPNLSDFNNIAGTAYDAVADNAITATTVESGPSTSTNTTYSNPGSSLGYLWYYQTLLAKGYHLGPTIDHDNHYTTFGKTTTSRTAIIAPSLSKTAIVTAMRNMNFYATQDCDSKVDFTINTKIMGSLLTDRFAPNISVTVTDITNPPTAAVIRVMFGIPGSGTMAVKIDSAIGSSLSFTDINLSNNATGYYYIDITNGTSRIITSPIWYSRNDALGPLPVKLSSFTVQKIDNSAKISWSTEQENNSSHFIVERSVDGRTWNAIATVAAAGNSSRRIDYSTYDNTPMRGINYYRLKQVDKDAKFDYSTVEKALFNSSYTAQVVPNPAKDFINLYIAKSGNQQASIQVLNAAGKLVYRTTSAQSQLKINTATFSKGLYFVKVIDADNVTAIKVFVQ
jgi:trimeric autotransporter adhesin